MDEKDIYNSDEIIKKFFITKRTLSEWIKNKPSFPKPFKIGRRLLWKKSEIDEYIEKLS
ncbi:MAG: helix-turn-helix domain-containing protein [Firmicutes bacterium]|nr:helix-turn-helix domain-containing protein [Bacillota bacterium]